MGVSVTRTVRLPLPNFLGLLERIEGSSICFLPTYLVSPVGFAILLERALRRPKIRELARRFGIEDWAGAGKAWGRGSRLTLRSFAARGNDGSVELEVLKPF